VATLDDAAEALVIKLRGLDSEIEESEHRLQELRGQIDGTVHDVDQEWAALTEAVSTFLTRIHDEGERLEQETRQALQAAAQAQQALASAGAAGRAEIAEGKGRLEGLAQHATALKQPLESLASQAGEAPAHSLAQRAAHIEEELQHAMAEARDFVRNDVVHSLEELAHDVRERGQAVRAVLAEECTSALQGTFDEWTSKVDELEQYVKAQGFLASHEHARNYVDYALGECGLFVQEHVNAVVAVVERVGTLLQELASHARETEGPLVLEGGHELLAGLEAARAEAAQTVTALDAVKDRLATMSFVQI